MDTSKSFVISVLCDQNVAHTWEYFFNQINLWWPKSFYTSARTKRFFIQTFIGGMVFEDFGEGDGLVWGDVIGVDYLKTLEVRGNMTRAFGGPVLTFEKYQFEEVGEQTKLSLSFDFMGEVSPSTVKSIRTGWEDLLNTHFKGYIKERE